MLNLIRKVSRKLYDSLYCKNIDGKIRIGLHGDIRTLIEKIPLQIVYSGGVGKDISFELEMISKYNSQDYVYDPSPTGTKTIENLEVKLMIYIFIRWV
jgi:hypothetical protein